MTEVYNRSPVPRQDHDSASVATTTTTTHTSDIDSVHLRSPVASTMSDDLEPSSNAHQYLSISRPLSRASVNSMTSNTATKDGVEGKPVNRRGIPAYPLNLINKMYSNYVTRSNFPRDMDSDDDENAALDGVSVESLKSVSMSSMIPHYSQPETPREVSDSEVYGEDTVEFDKESKTDYERFLMQGSGDEK